jgi:hypothetical protein
MAQFQFVFSFAQQGDKCWKAQECGLYADSTGKNEGDLE